MLPAILRPSPKELRKSLFNLALCRIEARARLPRPRHVREVPSLLVPLELRHPP